MALPCTFLRGHQACVLQVRLGAGPVLPLKCLLLLRRLCLAMKKFSRLTAPALAVPGRVEKLNPGQLLCTCGFHWRCKFLWEDLAKCFGWFPVSLFNMTHKNLAPNAWATVSFRLCRAASTGSRSTLPFGALMNATSRLSNSTATSSPS